MDHLTFAQLLGNYGEFVGAIAVVVTLAYLAIQIRNQNSEARAAAMHEIWVGFRDSISAFGDQQSSEVYTKALAGQELADAEQMQLIVGVQRIMRVWEEAFMQKNKGRLDNEVWEAMVTQFSSVMGNHAFQTVWRLRKDVYGSKFRTFVDSLPASDYRIK